MTSKNVADDIQARKDEIGVKVLSPQQVWTDPLTGDSKPSCKPSNLL